MLDANTDGLATEAKPEAECGRGPGEAGPDGESTILFVQAEEAQREGLAQPSLLARCSPSAIVPVKSSRSRRAARRKSSSARSGSPHRASSEA